MLIKFVIRVNGPEFWNGQTHYAVITIDEEEADRLTRAGKAFKELTKEFPSLYCIEYFDYVVEAHEYKSDVPWEEDDSNFDGGEMIEVTETTKHGEEVRLEGVTAKVCGSDVHWSFREKYGSTDLETERVDIDEIAGMVARVTS